MTNLNRLNNTRALHYSLLGQLDTPELWERAENTAPDNAVTADLLAGNYACTRALQSGSATALLRLAVPCKRWEGGGGGGERQEPAAGSESSAESTAVVQKEARRNTETDLNLLNQVLIPSCCPRPNSWTCYCKSENTHILAQIKHTDETQPFNVGFVLCTSRNV